MAGVLSQRRYNHKLTIAKHMNNIHSTVRRDFRTNLVALQTSDVPPLELSSVAP